MAMTEAAPAPATTAGRAPGHAAERPLWRPIPGSPLLGWLGPLGVTAFGFLLRFWHLATPAKTAFDEVYYSCDAQMLMRFGYEHAHRPDNVCIVDSSTPGGSYVVHPPLGKWLIGLGEQVFGYNASGGKTAAFGWRISACVFGALSILIVCRLGRRLFRSTLLGCFAGGLLALDGLHFVQSRMAMLDVFLMFFVLAAAACLVADRDWGRRRLASRLGTDLSTPGPRLGFRPWRLLAGIMLGCAGGSKWSAVYFVVAFALLAFAWDVGARRTAGIPKPFLAALWRDALPLVLWLFVVPVVTYVLTWAGWFVTHDGWRRTCGDTRWGNKCGPVRGWIEYHKEVYRFHVKLGTPHAYESKPWGWLLLARPVAYFYESPRQGTAQAVLGIGTPAIWWASIVALIGCAWGWVSRRDWRASFILVAFAAGFVPWFWPSGRTEFLFYALPAVPFMCLALAYCAGLVLGRSSDSDTRRQVGVVVVGVYSLLVIVNFFYLYPILAAKVVPYETWHARMWFTSWI